MPDKPTKHQRALLEAAARDGVVYYLKGGYVATGPTASAIRAASLVGMRVPDNLVTHAYRTLEACVVRGWLEPTLNSPRFPSGRPTHYQLTPGGRAVLGA